MCICTHMYSNTLAIVAIIRVQVLPWFQHPMFQQVTSIPMCVSRCCIASSEHLKCMWLKLLLDHPMNHALRLWFIACIHVLNKQMLDSLISAAVTGVCQRSTPLDEKTGGKLIVQNSKFWGCRAVPAAGSNKQWQYTCKQYNTRNTKYIRSIDTWTKHNFKQRSCAPAAQRHAQNEKCKRCHNYVTT